VSLVALVGLTYAIQLPQASIPSIHCAFLGYGNLHKGYKCLDITSRRIYISRDVIFKENVFPFGELHHTVGARYSSDVLLVPEFSLSRGSADLPLDNSPPKTIVTRSYLYVMILCSRRQSQVSTIIRCVARDPITGVARQVRLDLRFPRQILCPGRYLHQPH
jgi:hypothetical protein